jgi:hypothetical protein
MILRSALLALLLGCAPVLGAQDVQPSARLQLGGGVGPGTGVVVGYSAPKLGIFTQEAAVYADYTPRVVGGSGRLLVAVGAGGGLRLFRLADALADFEPGPLDLDAGLRLGPSFYYAFFERSAEEEARSFRVMLEAFVRGSAQLGSGRRVFVELGGQAPSLRGGLSIGL